MFARAGQGEPEVGQRLGMVGPELDRGLQRAHGAPRITQVEQRGAEIRMRHDRLAVGHGGAAEMRGGILQQTQSPQLVAEIEVGVAEPGLELDRAFEAGPRVVEPALAQVDVAQIVLCGGDLRVQLDRAGDERLRFVEPARLQRDHAQQMHGVEMLRHRREDLAVRRVRFLQAAGLMMRDGNVEQRRVAATGRTRPASARRHAAIASVTGAGRASEGDPSRRARLGRRHDGGEFIGHDVDERLRVAGLEQRPLEPVGKAGFGVDVELV